MVPFGKILARAWHYSLNWKRVAPFFLLLVPFVVLFAAFIDSAVSLLGKYGLASAAGMPPLEFMAGLSLFFLLLIAVTAIVFLADLYVRGVLIENARSWYLGKRVSFRRSRPAVKGRYLSLLAAVIIVKLISSGLGIIPAVGVILSIIVTLVFLVVLQSIVVSRKGVFDSLRDSYDIFMRRKLETFAFWLVTSLISMAFFVIAITPLIIAAWPVFATYLSSVSLGASAVPLMLTSIKSSLPQIFAAGLVSAFILGFIQVFRESATTFFYLEAKKRK